MKFYTESHSGWSAKPCVDGTYEVRDASDWPLATIEYDYRFTCNATNQQRANMLAAAPEMMEALTFLVNAIDQNWCASEEDLNKAKAALAKARGEPASSST